MTHTDPFVVITWHKQRSRSHKLAHAIYNWLKRFPGITPWMSQDIDKGEPWLVKLIEIMGSACYQIACITDECRESTWMAFEAGCLVGRYRSNMTWFYIDDEDELLPDSPLRHFQATRLTSPDCWNLWRAIDRARRHAEDRAEDDTGDVTLLEAAFNAAWAEFESSAFTLSRRRPDGRGVTSSAGMADVSDGSAHDSGTVSPDRDTKVHPIGSMILTAMHSDDGSECQFIPAFGVISQGQRIVRPDQLPAGVSFEDVFAWLTAAGHVKKMRDGRFRLTRTVPSAHDESIGV